MDLRYSWILKVLLVHKTYAYVLEYGLNKSFIFVFSVDQNMSESNVKCFASIYILQKLEAKISSPHKFIQFRK